MVSWVRSSLVMTTDMVFRPLKSKTGENSPFCFWDETGTKPPENDRTHPKRRKLWHISTVPALVSHKKLRTAFRF